MITVNCRNIIVNKLKNNSKRNNNQVQKQFPKAFKILRGQQYPKFPAIGYFPFPRVQIYDPLWWERNSKMASEERCFLQKREIGSVLQINKRGSFKFSSMISFSKQVSDQQADLSLYSKIYALIECWILRFVPFILESSLPALAIVTFKLRFGPKSTFSVFSEVKECPFGFLAWLVSDRRKKK